MREFHRVTLYTDGSSLGNPGKAGVGVVIYNEADKVVKKVAEFIGVTTNNVAEYMALIYALEEALHLKAKEVECFLDSELLVRQLKGSYKVRDNKLRLLYHQVRHLENFFENVNFHHTNREGNKEADRLARKAAKEKRE